MIYWPAKAPGESEDFEFDFSGALQTSETISSRTVTASGVTKDSDANSGTAVQVWLSGGTLGTPGIVTCTIVTSLGRTYVETGILPIGEEPVTLAMAKDHCRVTDDSEDDYLLGLIQSAREYAEAYCGVRVLPAAVQMSFAAFCDLQRLTWAPVQSVTSVQYFDASGVLQTLAPTVYETLNIGAEVLRPAIRLAYNQSWPSIRDVQDAVRVNAVVGYAIVPRPIIFAILLLVGQWFDNRSPVAVDVRGTPAELPNAVTALLSNFRRLAL